MRKLLPNSETGAQSKEELQGNRLKALRRERKETQQDVADAVGVTIKTYRDWEKGGQRIGKTFDLNALAGHFDVSCDYLLAKSGFKTIDAKEVSEITGLSDEAIGILQKEKGVLYPLSAPLGEIISRLLHDYKNNRGKSVIASLDRYAHTTEGSHITINAHTGEIIPRGGLTGEDYLLSDIALKGVESAALKYRAEQLNQKEGK